MASTDEITTMATIMVVCANATLNNTIMELYGCLYDRQTIIDAVNRVDKGAYDFDHMMAVFTVGDQFAKERSFTRLQECLLESLKEIVISCL
jgi:hypothetical protein